MKGVLWKQLGESLQLLSPPPLVLRLLEMVEDPGCTIGQIAGVVRHDPALCSKLLRTVNSPLYYQVRPVTTIEHAVRLLGVRGLAAMALGVSVPAFRDQPAPLMNDFSRRSVVGAIVARELAAREGDPSPEDVLVAGLLRDIGIIALYRVYPEEAGELLAAHLGTDQAVSQCGQRELEEAKWGLDHARLSAHILESWRLPPELTEPVAHHHCLERAPASRPAVARRAVILQMADAVALWQLAPSPEALRASVRLAGAHFGMNLESLAAFLEPLAPKIQAFAALLDIDLAAEELHRLAPDSAPGRDSAPAGSPQPRPGTFTVGGGDGGVTVVTPVPSRRTPAPAPAPSPDDDGHTPLPGPARGLQDLPAELRGHPRYTVLGVIGSGGMGVVYKARHRLMGRLVAVKVIRDAFLADPVLVERFHREVRTAARLSHPNVVTAYDAEQAGGTHFLVMEYVDGTSLSTLVERDGPLPVGLACDYVRQAALGLEHAHQHQLIHRDIKPHNLMATAAGQVKILDFGLACLCRSGQPSPDGALTEFGTVLGTPDFLAPEQANCAEDIDGRADLYSLGCTFYYLLTGRVPFPGRSVAEKLMNHYSQEPEPVESLRPEVPPAVAAAVRRLMAKQPRDRYGRPGELAAALAPFAGATAPPADNPEPPAAAPAAAPVAARGWSAVAAPAVALAVVFLASILAGLWAFGR